MANMSINNSSSSNFWGLNWSKSEIYNKYYSKGTMPATISIGGGPPSKNSSDFYIQEYILSGLTCTTNGLNSCVLNIYPGQTTYKIYQFAVSNSANIKYTLSNPEIKTVFIKCDSSNDSASQFSILTTNLTATNYVTYHPSAFKIEFTNSQTFEGQIIVNSYYAKWSL